jgi:hypothetical protein
MPERAIGKYVESSMPYLIEVPRGSSGVNARSAQTQFVVRANGPCGISWLSELSALGLRTLVTRDRAQLFPTIEEAESAIDKMPTGYKLARVSFAIELSLKHREPRARKRKSSPVRRF